jgi:hypothetical protein
VRQWGTEDDGCPPLEHQGMKPEVRRTRSELLRDTLVYRCGTLRFLSAVCPRRDTKWRERPRVDARQKSSDKATFAYYRLIPKTPLPPTRTEAIWDRAVWLRASCDLAFHLEEGEE